MTTQIQPRFENVESLLDEYEAEEYDDQREIERYPLVRPVRVLLDDKIVHGLFSRDISVGGMGTIGQNEFEIGTVAYLAVHSLQQQDDIVMQAEVMWCRQYGYGYHATGWRFLQDVN